MEITELFLWVEAHLNYFWITVLMAIESSFIPFPSEVVVPPAAYFACTEGSNLNIYLVVVFATLGALIGALVNYYLAVWIGRPLVYKFANSRFGHMCLIDEAKDIFAPIKVYLILPLIPFHLFDASVQHRQKKILIDPVLNIFLILLDKFLIPFFNILKFLCGLF